MAQNVQRRSHPEAIFSGATGPLCNRVRNSVGPDAGACPGSDTAAAIAGRAAGEIGSNSRRSTGVCAAGRWPSTTSPSSAARSG